ncbi:MAG: hypothetical protein QM831_23890 [Kofleriaceae bacterium]
MTLVPAVAHAFHNGSVFDKPPGAGGGGGLFFTGSSRDRGWDCSICHIDPPNRLALVVTSQPTELLADHAYTPGTAYQISIAFADPASQLGVAATRSNFNAMVTSFFDPSGADAGSIGGLGTGQFYQRGNAILASDSTTVNETSWSFTWTAPPAGTGPVAFDLAVVDGNGANATGQMTLTDPLGDDVAMQHVVLAEAGSSDFAIGFVRTVVVAVGRGCTTFARVFI